MTLKLKNPTIKKATFKRVVEYITSGEIKLPDFELSQLEEIKTLMVNGAVLRIEKYEHLKTPLNEIALTALEAFYGNDFTEKLQKKVVAGVLKSYRTGRS